MKPHILIDATFDPVKRDFPSYNGFLLLKVFRNGEHYDTYSVRTGCGSGKAAVEMTVATAALEATQETRSFVICRPANHYRVIFPSDSWRK